MYTSVKYVDANLDAPDNVIYIFGKSSWLLHVDF